MTNRFAAYRALLGFTCQAPVFALFYLSNGVDYGGLMTLAIAFALFKVCCDIPAGILADRYGRRNALVARVVLEAASVAVLFDHRFLLSAALAGAAFACSSGAESALVYEHCGREYRKVFGRATSWGFVSTAMAALIGSLLATVSFEAVYALRLAALALAVVVAAGFEESPRAHRRPVPPSAAPPNRGLLKVFVFVGLLGAVHVAALQLHQPYLRSIGIPLTALGALYVIFQLATAWGARAAHRLGGSFLFIAGASVAGFAVLALPAGLAGVTGVLILKFAHGVSLPTVSEALNTRVAPGARATMLSFRSLFEGSSLLVVAPVIGWAADAVSLPSAFAAAAALAASALLFTRVACESSDVSRWPVSSRSAPARA